MQATASGMVPTESMTLPVSVGPAPCSSQPAMGTSAASSKAASGASENGERLRLFWLVSMFEPPCWVCRDKTHLGQPGKQLRVGREKFSTTTTATTFCGYRGALWLLRVDSAPWAD